MAGNVNMGKRRFCAMQTLEFQLFDAKKESRTRFFLTRFNFLRRNDKSLTRYLARQGVQSSQPVTRPRAFGRVKWMESFASESLLFHEVFSSIIRVLCNLDERKTARLRDGSPSTAA
jgi:hypothetical protein